VFVREAEVYRRSALGDALLRIACRMFELAPRMWASAMSTGKRVTLVCGVNERPARALEQYSINPINQDS